MSSEQRKKAIQSLLRRGQLKQLSVDLNMSYSYLSQAFSTSTSTPFSAVLARKVEKSLGLNEGQLDDSEQLVVQRSNSRGLLALALRGRVADLSKAYPNKRITLNEVLTVGGIAKRVDLLVFNEDDSIFLIAEQSKEYDKGPAEQLIMLMAISGAEYGVIFAPDSGVNNNENEFGFSKDQKRSRWYQSQKGKIVEITEGPGDIFNSVGI